MSSRTCVSWDVSCHSQTKCQWPFQGPKLQVPTIYKVYVRGMYENISPSSTALYGTVLYLYSRVLKFLLKMGIQPSMLGLVTMMGPSEKHIPDGSPRCIRAFWDGFKQFKHAKITKIWSFPKSFPSRHDNTWQYPNPSYHPVVIYSPWLSNLNPHGDDWETPHFTRRFTRWLQAAPDPSRPLQNACELHQVQVWSHFLGDLKINRWQKWCIFNV